VTSCSSEGARRFGGTYRFHLRSQRVNQARNKDKTGDKWRSACRLLLPVSCLTYSFTTKMEVICSCEKSGYLRTTRHCNPEDHSFHIFFLISLCGVRLCPLLRRLPIGLLYQPRMINERGAIGGMITGRGHRSTWRKPAPVLLCPRQISHDEIWDRTRPPRWEAGY
jgi:hypothetical protein